MKPKNLHGNNCRKDPISFEAAKRDNDDQKYDDDDFELIVGCCKSLNRAVSNIPVIPKNVMKLRGHFAFAVIMVGILRNNIDTCDHYIQKAIEMNAACKEINGKDSPSLMNFIDKTQKRKDKFKALLKETFNNMIILEFNAFELESGANEDNDV